jgi:hypothetical protein
MGLGRECAEHVGFEQHALARDINREFIQDAIESAIHAIVIRIEHKHFMQLEHSPRQRHAKITAMQLPSLDQILPIKSNAIIL